MATRCNLTQTMADSDLTNSEFWWVYIERNLCKIRIKFWKVRLNERTIFIRRKIPQTIRSKDFHQTVRIPLGPDRDLGGIKRGEEDLASSNINFEILTIKLKCFYFTQKRNRNQSTAAYESMNIRFFWLLENQSGLLHRPKLFLWLQKFDNLYPKSWFISSISSPDNTSSFLLNSRHLSFTFHY